MKRQWSSRCVDRRIARALVSTARDAQEGCSWMESRGEWWGTERNWGGWPPHDLAWADGSRREQGVGAAQQTPPRGPAKTKAWCVSTPTGAGGSVPGGDVSSGQKHRVERTILPPMTISVRSERDVGNQAPNLAVWSTLVCAQT